MPGSDSRPIVIAHRGASGYRPEHTLAAYQLAIEQRADVIEPDLVVTRDGVLIARHENEIGGTTDVAAHPEFASRHCSKTIDGVLTSGWFAEDFTLQEIKTLRARERLPEIRPGSTQYDGQFEIPTFAEIIALAAAAAHPVAIYPETKHPTWFAHEGHYQDGTPIAFSLGQNLIDELLRARFTDPRRVYIQSFEFANLIELKQRIMPAAGVDFPLMQLIGNLHNTASPHDGWHTPHDMHYHIRHGADLASIYGDLIALLPDALRVAPPYSDLITPQVLAWLRHSHAFGIAPWKDNLLPRSVVQGETGARPRMHGSVDSLIDNAHAAGLHVHTYTLRCEAEFLAADQQGVPISVTTEARLLLDAGVDGFFIDQPDLGVAARDDWLASVVD